MKFWWANKVYNPQVTLAASLGFRIWQPLPMFTSWFCHDILWNKVQLCLKIGYTVILHSLSWFLCNDNFLDFFFFFKYFMSFLCQNIRHWNFILLQWTDHVTHLFLDDHLFYMHSVHFDWIFFHVWCSLGHGRKFIKDAPSACRINGHINHFDMKLVMFLINVEKKPRLLFWCIFFLKFCLKK